MEGHMRCLGMGQTSCLWEWNRYVAWEWDRYAAWEWDRYVAWGWFGCVINFETGLTCVIFCVLDLGMGLKFTRQFSKKRMKHEQTNVAQEGEGDDGEGEEDTDGRAEPGISHPVRALYAFHGSNEDEVKITSHGERG